MAKLKLKKGEALVMRTCNADGTSWGGFRWPKSGLVTCTDWKPTATCGNGLHGLLWGVGGGDYLNFAADSAWLVVKVIEADCVWIDGDKVKFPKGEVVFFGERFAAVSLITEHAPAGSVIVMGTATAGVRGTATAGYMGTATAGVRGTAKAGYMGTATAGYMGTATAGYMGTATAGYMGTATAGVRGTAKAGYMGTATAGYMGTATAGVRGTAKAGVRGTATAGVRGTAKAGYMGTATAGVRGTAKAGYMGTATAGEDGVISIMYWNGEKYKRAIFAVGENGIEPNTPYRLDDNGKPVKVVKK